jgi:hypothetical protein
MKRLNRSGRRGRGEGSQAAARFRLTEEFEPYKKYKAYKRG